ncbi:MAG: hypothetical protein INR69_01270 [Mucilaginibacter polytrichastri]|nr:hypothetical protein [Mucilaginibacter polytrichastri]
MKDFEQIEKLWKAQTEERVRPADDVLRQVKKDVGGIGRKLYGGLIAMSITLVVMFLILFFIPFHAATTRVGIGIVMLTVCLYALIMLRDYRLITRHDITADPVSYLQQIKKYQRNRASFSGWLFYAYILLLSAGFGLYFIEVFASVAYWIKLAASTITAAWFLFCTFYLKTRISRSEEEKVALIIDRLERLQKQFG